MQVQLDLTVHYLFTILKTVHAVVLSTKVSCHTDDTLMSPALEHKWPLFRQKLSLNSALLLKQKQILICSMKQSVRALVKFS